ncbi:exodeoxyribonuclease III [Luteolibacter pohnpeiensis]|uniref:Exodeoxyribonuclease III n=1 Tax=Luteolibacter pohnpeiensis TaxID=454153 RepID=A0A934SAH5_9BACT|nr:exodeoxyribonuclease III [Luteolibacter pohnpeiensis]MBK1883891.1 exodeoxyribonuclease III [Luteolibacter pohnpeiensis]
MKLLSWNVNGMRAVLGKGFGDFVSAEQPDILCLQETKARPEQVPMPPELDGYHAFWNSAQKPGYSGVAVFTRSEPIEVQEGMGFEDHDKEGRVLTLEYPDFILVNVYTPNSQDGLRRLPYRMEWDEVFRQHLMTQALKKPVIFCGDLNVAHQEIDLARPKDNRMSAGFSDEERAGFGKLLDSGFTDSFRHLHPETRDAYSWWSYRGGARGRNVGWRIDYFGLSTPLVDRLKSAEILPHVMGSDHCPVSITLA